jgi:prefoldin beta subunit
MNNDKEAEEKIQQLTMLEQNIQNTSLQKQGFHLQLLEIEAALKEIENSTETYKIVANIMVKSDKAELRKDLNDKKEMVELRIRSLEKQESKLREKVTGLQQEVLGNIEKGR